MGAYIEVGLYSGVAVKRGSTVNPVCVFQVYIIARVH